MKQVEFTTSKGQFLAVLMHDRYASSFANIGYLVVKIDNPATDIGEDEMFPPDRLDKALDRVSKLPEYITLPAIKLPDGDWKVTGIGSKLTDEQCAEIVEHTEYYDPHAQPYPIPAYKDYLKDVWKWQAKEYFASLMTSLECYSENPYGEKPTETFNHPHWEYTRAKHKEANERTGKWLILKKIS